MTTLDAFTISTNIVKMVIKKMDNIRIPQRKFLVHLFPLLLGIRGRVNFLQMERYGQYSERTYRDQFDKKFDYATFNSILIDKYCSPDRIIAFDPSYINKSGKKTEGLGYFYSGGERKYKRGLEIGCLAVIDLTQNTAYHLSAIQSPPKASKIKDSHQHTLIDFYAEIIRSQSALLLKHSSILSVDGFFAKKKFINTCHQSGFTVVSRLRADADLKYIYNGVKKAGRGRPRIHDGKIDLDNIDHRRIKLVYEDDQMSIKSGIVYSVGLKRNIRLCITTYKNDKGIVSKPIYHFSTDINMDSLKIVNCYKSRFQIEFMIRDAKQHAGLEHCQSVSAQKLDTHFNSSLTAVSVAKAVIRQRHGTDEEVILSINDIKTEIHNRMLAELIFSIYGIDRKLIKNTTNFQKILDFGKIAA